MGTDRLPIVPHPIDAKGKWLGIDEANNYYPESVVTPVQQDYLQLKQAYRNNNLDVNAIATRLQTD